MSQTNGLIETDLKYIGSRRPLLDGEPKVTGSLRFGADLPMRGVLEARIVTSPYAHANILSIDTSEAETLPGVVAVLTANDLPDITPGKRSMMMLARERVVYMGQPVALVLANDGAAALDALDLVMVDYEPLEAAMTVDDALAADAPLVWPSGTAGDTSEAAEHGAGGDEDETDDNAAPSNHAGGGTVGRGDVNAGLAEADIVLQRKYSTPMVHQSYIEPHVTLVQPDPMTSGANVWSSTQAIFNVRADVAAALKVHNSLVKVTSTPVGGGFGGKFVLYEPLVAVVAQVMNQPVRLFMTREEELLTAQPAPALTIDLTVGAKNDGTLTAVKADIMLDAGCYPSGLHGLVGRLMGSVYQAPNVEINGASTLTFKPSGGAYRGPGSPQASFAIESTLNDLAEQLDMDPFEIRRKNMSHEGEPMADGALWPGMGLEQVLNTAKEHPIWQNREEARAQGRGVGFGIGIWFGGIAGATAACMLDDDGTLNVSVASVDLTGGTATFALLAAEAFGIDPDKVRVTTGDTTSGLWSGGSGGSKITYTVGPAVIKAAEEARVKTLAIASDQLEVDPADLEIVDGKVQVKGTPASAIELTDIAKEPTRMGSKYAPVRGNGEHAISDRAPAFCIQLAEVSVDEDTGEVTVHKLAVLQDVGRALNPLTVEGQIMGGAVQGLGWALYEQMVYDESGQLLTGSLMDYTIPRIDHTPEDFEVILVEVPSKTGPMGARGVGEPPITATASAVANAVKDATGVRFADLPLTPQRVFEGLQARQTMN